jgi:hypothetical protein
MAADGQDAQGTTRAELKIRLERSVSEPSWLELRIATEPPVVARIIRNADGSFTREGAEEFRSSEQALAVAERLTADLQAGVQAGSIVTQGLRPLTCLVNCGGGAAPPLVGPPDPYIICSGPAIVSIQGGGDPAAADAFEQCKRMFDVNPFPTGPRPP